MHEFDSPWALLAIAISVFCLGLGLLTLAIILPKRRRPIDEEEAVELEPRIATTRPPAPGSPPGIWWSTW